MAHMDYIERDYFEDLFDMRMGYVLDFTNRTFQEFVYEKNVDVYATYSDMSKAKMLRAIMAEYDDITVGKLLLELMRYMQAKDMITEKNRTRFEKCASIGNRLIGRRNTAKQKNVDFEIKSLDADSELLLKKLIEISNCSDTPQARGFAFEKFI